ncbi:AmmeMemoRadiSam system radical SAM enzyme [Clostridium sp. FS41]|uniref:AmmeMemoRadiSam system radical SAM enzyme n=1 Tax=Clostridia TaxID=186801 RepID=UPI0005D4097E|nr:AmmeMemoRadiSam system radical SAM enzyme [Clostridium sp. FS41]KJJ69691.1 pyruvate formate-lyase 1-activating enzyme [Clostridium sp. FS41]
MKIRCDVCMHHCELDREQTGFCRARKNTGERIIPVNYGKITSLALDPIEKKPLAMFCPGTMILSAGSFGCNLRCPFCQNHEISMAGERESEAAYIEPGELAARAQALRPRGNIGVAYTYNEPLVGWEYVRDTARFIRAAGMKNVIVTNASVTDPVLDEILPLTDAMNIDLKGFTDQFYAKLGGDLGTVRHFIQRAAEACHVELTTLIVPGENDSEQEIKELASWVGGISSDIPLHITRFFPRWKMTDRGATDIRTVYSLAETARKSLKHVFIGNC